MTRRVSILLIIILAVLPLVAFLPLPVQKAHAAYTYNLYGSYNEDGYYAGAINVTLYRSDNSTLTFELDGTHVVNEANMPIVFKFDIGTVGTNETRTFFVRNITSENIYVFRPDEPYYTYYFRVVDFVGVTNGYLETLINVNGTDRIVERWSLSTLNELPFTCSFGSSYKLRLVCDEGTYYYPSFVAGASTTIYISITEDMFPVAPTSLAGIYVNGARMNSTHVKGAYLDSNGNTTWIYMMIAELGSSTPIVSTNVSANGLTYNWYDADEDKNYYILVYVSHQIRGILQWTFVCARIQPVTNPFSDLDTIFGTSTIFPIAMSQLPALFSILFVFGAFSIWNAGVGLVVGVLVAAFEVYVGFVNISWAWITVSLSIAVIVALSLAKEREPD